MSLGVVTRKICASTLGYIQQQKKRKESNMFLALNIILHLSGIITSGCAKNWMAMSWCIVSMLWCITSLMDGKVSLFKITVNINNKIDERND